jgi:single-strand DNA-binding protein
MGHLGTDPEVKEVGEGKKLARFSLATNSSYRRHDGEQVTETQWHYYVAHLGCFSNMLGVQFV